MYFLRHKHLILIFISSLVILLFYYVSLDGDSVNENVIDITGVEHEHVGSVGKRRSKLKRILYWNDFYGSKNFGFCCGRGPYLKHNCPNSQCYTSKDRREDLKSFDAIVFHSRSLNSKDIPKIRFTNQLYVFLTLESAAYPDIADFSSWDNFFNITMTYRLDSDVFMPYGRVVEHDNVPESVSVPDLSEKKHLAAWMVSNCHTQSRREDLIGDLKKYLPPDSIHIYGKCGTRKCPGKSQDERDECWEMLDKKYKFYLALENSICPDYVTEKMYEALKHNIVPIVLGGSNYKAMFPKDSFIDMMDFKNMSSLADYLVKLNEDDLHYSKYLKWKSRYSIKNSKYDTNQAHCDLCATIHQYSDEKKQKVISNLKKWFIDDKKCQGNSIWKQ